MFENCFGRLKQFRAIATRYDKTARNFVSVRRGPHCLGVID